MIIIRHHLLDLQPRARGLRSGLEALLDLLPQHRQTFLPRRSHDKNPRRIRMDDVRRDPAIGNIPLNHIPRHRLLPQHTDCIIRRDQRIERIDAFPGRSSRVSLLTKIFDPVVLVCRCAHQGGIAHFSRVRNQIDVYAVVFVCSSVYKADFAAAAFFGGRAEQDNFSWDGKFGHCGAGC